MHVINERSGYASSEKLYGGRSYVYRRRCGTCAVSRGPICCSGAIPEYA